MTSCCPARWHGVVLRSPHAAVAIRGIDTSAAKTVKGVHAIYSSADLDADRIGPIPCAVSLNNRDGSNMASPPHPVLASGMV
jgi:carbon-monoxide dehydrogenase large subunit